MRDMTPQQRRMALHGQLTRGRRIVAARLAAQWGCDERTLRRDLHRMRDVDRLPIAYDRVTKSWSYTQPVVGIQPTLVSEEDRRALLFSLQASAQLDATPVCKQAQRLYRTMLATLPPERATRFERMMASVRFTGPRLPPIRPEAWSVLLLCLEANETTHVTYTGGNDGVTTERDIDPYGLLMRDRHWILVGYCHLRQRVLTFALPRISKASTTDRTFKPPAGFMDKYLASAFDGVASTDDVATVVLRIGKRAPPYIADRAWSQTESRTTDNRGRIIVTFKTTALFMLEREVLADGEHIELLQPAHSRNRLRQAGRAIAAAHR